MRNSRAELYSGSEDADSVQLCVFRVGAAEYAIDIRRVREILPAQRLTPLPEAPGWEGVFEIRDTVVPVLDLRRRLGATPSVAVGKEKILICLLGRRQVALVVDAVVQVMRTHRSELRPAPNVSAGPYVIGVCGSPPALKLLLDVKALLSPTLESPK